MQSITSWLATLLTISAAVAKELTEIEVLSSKPTRCVYQYAYDMYGAHCVGLHLEKIPNLKSGIEILDFSENKLQEIKDNTLSGYTSIKFLYLTDNQIYQIEDNAFTSLTSLLTLDLSKNVLLTLPESILQLPSLRTLYLAHNPFPILHKYGLVLQKPPKSPLELLDVSDCKFQKLPDWGMLPQLTLYNISHNPLETLDAAHFSMMCSLKNVDLTDSIEKVPACDLKPTVTWLDEKNTHIQLNEEGYSKLNSKGFNACPTLQGSMAELNITYHLCKMEFSQVLRVTTSRRTWLTIGGGLAGFLVAFMLLLYIMHRRNVAQTKKPAKPEKTAQCGKHASAKLLNEAF